MKLDKFVDDISKNPAKAITYAVLLIIVIAVVYWLYTTLKESITQLADRVRTEKENPVKNDNLTQSQSWYSNSATTLFNAMNGWGTGWSDIYAIFQIIQNTDDWNELKRRYGTRTLNHFGYSDVTGNLIGHLQYELSSSEKTKLNNELSRIGSTDRI